ncbi:transglycosylase SLT domain-containing protein [Streptomyces sp. NBC_01724]|uniref:transglycosylase SLT domain-containing protein n=1 Tax=unclassified Streptomyces TaxID=2593676 RepID=UPI0028C3CD78|nr:MULTISPECIES: transglycosylase SLT domain-containing protein [unclassified Streptomyces]WTE50082.1 transglycosylase SLT domain-containing protein [Streptomyces sp. NBC_01620]WTE58171.1 transglycosylase SLT domain-containing protein [Streptomyces sp. NBC_01617]WTI85697.1 transglycosylase SLT domain-containing protein [Streptomyces sp. NBC_00724]WNO63210.1 transglycosylase SLT domain-containing protein [Streptomyces sp. AM2-3-1]WSC67790.1 transglycosylase SLT domain-containing protein [Strept
MPATGNHRRRKSSSLSRGFIAVTAGGAALALPVIGATTASAAPVQSVATVTKTVAPAAAPAKGIAAAKTTPSIYSVIAGDTLYKIATGHSVSGGWQQLYQDNREVIGADPAVIRPGMKLTIGAKAETTAAEPKPAASTATPSTAKPVTYTNDLDGWIKESLAVMAQHGIPGSYDGIHRNIMRESSGNPRAINNWDSNAAKGTPSKGLLQVIDPTFKAYHVPGTSMDPYDPVANITAACNYAAAKYGSIDNVFGAY